MSRPALVLCLLAMLALSGCSGVGDASQTAGSVQDTSTTSSPTPRPAPDSSMTVSRDVSPSRDASAAAGAVISQADSLTWRQVSASERSPQLALRLADGIVANGLTMEEVMGLLGPYADRAVPADSNGDEEWAYPVGESGMLYMSFRNYRAAEYRAEGFDRSHSGVAD